MFSIKDSLKYGWEKFKANTGILIGATATLFVVSMVGELDKDSIILGLVGSILGFIVQIGFNKMFLRISDGEQPNFTDLFKEYKLFWKYLGTSILQGLAMVGGLILLIVPGIIWAVRFSFATIIVVDVNMGPMNAMKESYAITKGKFWQLLGFFLVLGLINIAGFILLGIGLLVTIPVTMFAWVNVYRQLTREKAGVSVPITATPVEASASPI